jgi:hypothetical protein
MAQWIVATLFFCKGSSEARDGRLPGSLLRLGVTFGALHGGTNFATVIL